MGHDMRTQDIMTRGPTSITPDATIQDAARIMSSEDVGILPVVAARGDDRLVGVITDRDIAIRCVAEGRGSDCLVSDAMSSGHLTTCSEGDEVDSLLMAMRREKVRRVPIVDDRGSLVGIVAQADVVLKMKDAKKTEQALESISEPGGRHAR